MKNDPDKNFLVSLAVFAGTLVFLGVFIWVGLVSNLEKEKESYESNRAVLSELEQKVDLKQELKKEYESIGDDVDLIEASLLAEGDKLQFIEQLENIATSTGNTYEINNANEMYDTRSGKLTQINFNLKLAGEFAGIMSFLREVNSLPYLMNVSQFSITNEEGLLNTSLELQVFIH